MVEIEGLPSDPGAFIIYALLIGFGAVAIAKLYGVMFMRWKTPHRLGDAMNVDRAEVVEWSGEEGYVSAGGELWRATSKDALSPGDKVSVNTVDGLLLKVKKISA